MRKALLLACVAAVPNVVALPAAHAHPTYHYTGGCGLAVVSNVANTPSTTRWDGAVWLVAQASDAITGAPSAVPITVECEMRINGGVPGATILTSSGLGATTRVESFTLTVERGDVVTICDNVTVNNDFHKHCETAFVYDPIHETFYELGEVVTDSACNEIGALDGTGLDQPPAFDIHSDGDIYAIGDRVWVYDCPTDGDARRRYRAIHDHDPPIPTS